MSNIAFVTHATPWDNLMFHYYNERYEMRILNIAELDAVSGANGTMTAEEYEIWLQQEQHNYLVAQENGAYDAANRYEDYTDPYFYDSAYNDDNWY